MYARDVPPGTIFYHGTKADLEVGDLVRPGFGSNFVERELRHIYFSATLEAATWGAELAKGNGGGRIYIVEPTGPFEDDPNLTDKKFPGNMTASYRSLDSLRVTGEVEGWVGHSPERLQEMRDNLARLKELGTASIED
jgi:rifampin ADP-ribosylating transferase